MVVTCDLPVTYVKIYSLSQNWTVSYLFVGNYSYMVT
jgi:hypothetical protein